MNNNDIKRQARVLRHKGFSLGSIEKALQVPKTTVHSWVKDIKIKDHLKEKIKLSALKALQQGRMKTQSLNKQKRSILEEQLLKKGIGNVGGLSYRELFVAGIALYWGEGFKNIHERRLGFCNSDPAMIKFYLHWLEKCLAIKQQDLIARVTVNSAYKVKIDKIEIYWSQITGIPLSQFTKPFYQQTKWKKEFNNDKYHGVLRIHVKDSLEKLLEMKGWIEGLKTNMPG